MHSFTLPASQPPLTHPFLRLVCVLVVLVSFWRFEMPVTLLSVVGIAACALLWLGLRAQSSKPQCALIIHKDGSYAAVERGQRYDAQLGFALCSTNHILLRGRVTIDGRVHRQEWQLKRTDNEAFWRLACRWVQWLSSQGETKKPH